MGKPLTIDELKALEVGDWVWLESATVSKYAQKYRHDPNWFCFNGLNCLPYDNYGIKWIAYKNKEQVEAKGDVVDYELKYKALYSTIIELCERFNDKSYVKDFYYLTQGSKIKRIEYSAYEVERRLAELKGEK